MAIGWVGSVSPQSFYEGNLDAITAVVIGGCSLFGGRGSILGTLMVGVFRSGLNLSGVHVSGSSSPSARSSSSRSRSTSG